MSFRKAESVNSREFKKRVNIMLGPEQTQVAMGMIFWLDCMGTVVFAVSGVLRGWQKKFNVVGVAFLAAAVACGGGTIRDVLRGRPVPFFLQDALYFWLVLGTVVVMYALKFLVTPRPGRKMLMTSTLEVCDAIGLGVFSIIGASIAIHNLHHPHIAPMVDLFNNSADGSGAALFGLNAIAVVLFAVLTGAGGGIVRDVVAGRIPYAFSASWYAAFPALGGIVFYGLCRLGSGPINAWVVAVPTLVVTVARLVYWHFLEYEREQYAAVILLRDSRGRYLMEAGRTGFMSLIGGKWQSEDGPENEIKGLKNTAIREAREELGIELNPEFLKRVELKSSHDRAGLLTFRERSLRTDEMTKYHMAVFEYTQILDDSAMERIQDYREKPILPRNREFMAVDTSEIQPPTSSSPELLARISDNGKEGVVESAGSMLPVSYSLLSRIKHHAADARHVDGKPIFDGLL